MFAHNFTFLILTIFFLTSRLAAQENYVVGELLGRLGNFFFEIATASALAWDHDAIPTFPQLSMETHKMRNFQANIFFRCNTTCPLKPIRYTWSTPDIGYKKIAYRPNMKIRGYAQSEQYFSHHRDRLLKLFAPKNTIRMYIEAKYKKILNHPCSVSIHVRNYRKELPKNKNFIQYGKDYYQKAMETFPNTTLFVVTSDDIAFAKTVIPCEGKHVCFIDNEPFFIDFFLQTMCKHNIIANSSFSWWSAWLNTHSNKIVIRPEIWLKNYPPMDSPKEWIKIDAEYH